jgi:hypothetical protein
MRIEPIEAVSEAEDPDMPPKSMLAATFTSPSPPRKRPTKMRQELIRRSVIPLAFIS